METGILSDGSLSLRKKGDLFWKKYKLQEQAEELLKVDKKYDLLVADILASYESTHSDTEAQLDGNEFREYPPTATGRDVMRQAVVKAMIVRDRMRNDPQCDRNLLGSLSDAIDAFLDNKSKDRRACFEKAHAYEAAFWASQKENSELCEPEVYFKKKRIRPQDLDKFVEDIPENYWGQLRNGSVIAERYYPADKEESNVFGVILHAKHEGFKEIIWISIRPEYMEDRAVCSDFLKYVIWEASERREYKGMFMELHADEHISEMTEMLRSAGMSIYFEKNNIYEGKLSDVRGQDKLFAASDRLKCVSVSQLSGEDRENLELRIENSRQPVPVAYPIRWNTYRSDLSVAYLGKDPKAAGLMLISEVGDSLDIELLYGSNPVIVAALSGAALKKAYEHLDPGQKLLIPIVNEYSRPLIKKLIPTAVRGDIAEAVVWFK
ncbi:MAG: hypothetical protein K6E19_02850 [Lachnospiraceae bacterium]|nr:hypothetical protein [Lachnospiraceae bacterium]